jgi:MFS family permease
VTVAREVAGLRRDRATLALYGALGCLGYLFAGLGPVLPRLRDELGLGRGEVALYPSALALGLLVVGLGGHLVIPRLGRLALPAAITLMCGGAAVLGFGRDRFTCGAGALLLGLGAAALVQAVPVGLRALHGERATAAVGEANGVSSSGGLLSGPLVGAAIALGVGWRGGFLVPPMLAGAVLVAMMLKAAPPGVAADPSGRRPRTPATGPFRARWVDILLSVSAEFCFALWAADLLSSERGLRPAVASTVAGLFILGMVAGRVVAAPLTRLVPDERVLVGRSALLAAFGGLVVWALDDPVATGAGLFLAGLGIAMLYPLNLVRALSAWPREPDRAAARCALASGFGIGLAPLVLGALADAVGLGTAMVLPVVLLSVLAGRSLAS